MVEVVSRPEYLLFIFTRLKTPFHRNRYFNIIYLNIFLIESVMCLLNYKINNFIVEQIINEKKNQLYMDKPARS